MSVGYNAQPAPELFLGALADSLLQVDPQRTTQAQFEQIMERSLRSALGSDLPESNLFYSGGERLFLGNDDLQQMYRLVEEIEQAEIRETIAFLEQVVIRREAQDDLWPEGRLELGIACALVHDYEKARRWLEEVVDICEGGGKFAYANQMAA